MKGTFSVYHFALIDVGPNWSRVPWYTIGDKVGRLIVRLKHSLTINSALLLIDPRPYIRLHIRAPTYPLCSGYHSAATIRLPVSPLIFSSPTLISACTTLTRRTLNAVESANLNPGHATTRLTWVEYSYVTRGLGAWMRGAWRNDLQ